MTVDLDIRDTDILEALTRLSPKQAAAFVADLDQAFADWGFTLAVRDYVNAEYEKYKEELA